MCTNFKHRSVFKLQKIPALIIEYAECVNVAKLSMNDLLNEKIENKTDCSAITYLEDRVIQ